MQVNLSEKTIERICRMAFARMQDLETKLYAANIYGKQENMLMQERTDAADVYAIFREFVTSETFSHDNRMEMEAFKAFVKRLGGNADTATIGKEGYYSYTTEQGEQKNFTGFFEEDEDFIWDYDYYYFCHADEDPYRRLVPPCVKKDPGLYIINGFMFFPVDLSVVNHHQRKETTT